MPVKGMLANGHQHVKFRFSSYHAPMRRMLNKKIPDHAFL
jgi:hypothetical protein